MKNETMRKKVMPCYGVKLQIPTVHCKSPTIPYVQEPLKSQVDRISGIPCDFINFNLKFPLLKKKSIEKK